MNIAISDDEATSMKRHTTAPKKRLLSQNILVLDEIESNREVLLAANAG